jgi:glucose dehydrogenase
LNCQVTCIAAGQDVLCVGSEQGSVYVLESKTGLLVKEIPYQSNFYVAYTPAVTSI